MLDERANTDTARVAKLLDLSVDGARLSLPDELGPGRRMLLTFDAATGLTTPIPADVRWSKPGRRGTWLIGCAFRSDLPEESIEDMVRRGILDSRELARRGITGEADVWKELDPSALHVRLVDLSSGGFSVVAPRQASIGQRLRVVLDNPATKEPTEILGNIRWQGKTHDGFLLGCQFENDDYYHHVRDLLCPAGDGSSRAGAAGAPTRSRNPFSWLKGWRRRKNDLVASASFDDLRNLAEGNGTGNLDKRLESALIEHLRADTGRKQMVQDAERTNRPPEHDAALDPSPGGPHNDLPGPTMVEHKANAMCEPPASPVSKAAEETASDPPEEARVNSSEHSCDVYGIKRRFQELPPIASGHQGTAADASPDERAKADSSEQDGPTAEQEESSEFEQRLSALESLATTATDELSDGLLAEGTTREDATVAAPTIAGTDAAAVSGVSVDGNAGSVAIQERSAAQVQVAVQGAGGSGAGLDGPPAPAEATPAPPSIGTASAVSAIETPDETAAMPEPEPGTLAAVLAETAAIRAKQQRLIEALQQCERRLECFINQWAELQQQPDVASETTLEGASCAEAAAKSNSRKASRLWSAVALLALCATVALGLYRYFPATMPGWFNTEDWRALLPFGAAAAPASVADSYSINEDGTLEIAAPGPLSNDSNPSQAILVRRPEHGTVTLNENGAFQYSPHADFNGTDRFWYSAGQGTGDADAATVTITVRAVDDAPVAAADRFTTSEDEPLTVGAPGVLGNDTDAEADPLKAVLVRGPAHGTLSLKEDGLLHYTPEPNCNGSDSFAYRATGGELQSEEVLVTIQVTPVNDLPVAVADHYETAQDTSLTVAAPGLLRNDTDADREALSVALSSGPAHGTLELAGDGAFQYTPGRAFHGSDSFTYQVQDGSGGSAAATVTIAVVRAEKPLAAVGFDDVLIGPSDDRVVIDLSEKFTGEGSLAFEVAANSNPGLVGVKIAHQATLELSANGRTNGVAEVRIRATNDQGQTAEDSFTITVERAEAEPARRANDPRVAAESEAIARSPQSSEAWRNRAHRYGEIGLWEDALADYTRAIALGAGDVHSWSGRAAAHAELGQWKRAHADFAQAIALQPRSGRDAYIYYLQALTALGGDDSGAYRNTCAALVQFASESRNANDVTWAAWACALAPQGAGEFLPIAPRLKTIASRTGASAFASITLGAIYYRSGRFSDALEQLERTAHRPAGSGPLPYDWFLLAMTYQQLGDTLQARSWLERAVQFSDRLTTRAEGAQPAAWNRALTLLLLQREASAMIESDVP